MQTVDERPETIHLYVVRENEPNPSFAPIILSALALLLVVAVSVVSPYQQPVTRAVIRVPAVLLPIKTFSASVAVIPTGIRIYPATTAHGVLTITNGSVISQTLPAGFTTVSNNNISVVTDRAVFIPAGNAYGYGYATISAHALLRGKAGNIPAYRVNQVEGSSVYIRNLAAFHGGRDSYSVKYVSAQDKLTALLQARGALSVQISAYKNGLHYPCNETYLYERVRVAINWRCQFVTFSLPSYMRISSIRILGKNLLIAVTFTPRQKREGMK